jgi:hypothetical protein
MHSEMSYSSTWPSRLVFICDRAPLSLVGPPLWLTHSCGFNPSSARCGRHSGGVSGIRKICTSVLV